MFGVENYVLLDFLYEDGILKDINLLWIIQKTQERVRKS
jgi:hypothetical protein